MKIHDEIETAVPPALATQRIQVGDDLLAHRDGRLGRVVGRIYPKYERGHQLLIDFIGEPGYAHVEVENLRPVVVVDVTMEGVFAYRAVAIPAGVRLTGSLYLPPEVRKPIDAAWWLEDEGFAVLIRGSIGEQKVFRIVKNPPSGGYDLRLLEGLPGLTQ